MQIGDLVGAIQQGRLRISDHAYDEARNDGLSLDDVLSSVFVSEIIEQYLEDRPYPSCLLYGRMPRGDPVHSVWAYNEEQQWAVLITVYRPDPSRWIHWRERRRQP